MSQSSSITISCPQCGHDQEFTSWNSINVSLNPEKKAELKSGALNRLVCAQCGEQSDVNYPTLYHDPERQFMVWLHREGGEAELGDMAVGDFLQSYHLRLVRSRNQLVEKTHLLDLGLDDRIMEIYKVIVRSNAKHIPAGDLLFAGIGTGQQGTPELQFAVVTEAGPQFIGTKRDTYDDFATEFAAVVDAEPLEAGKWHRIDEGYATGLIRRQLPDVGL